MHSSSPVDPTSVYLAALFNHLNQADFPYAVMRNYKSLPDSANGSDLDILVPSGKGKETELLLRSAAKEAGGTIIGVARTAGFFKINAFGESPLEPGSWWGLRVDVSVALKFKGAAEILSDSVLRDRLVKHRGIPVLPKDIASVLGVLKEALYNESIPHRYLGGAQKAISENREQLMQDLSPLGMASFQKFAEICEYSSAEKGIHKKLKQLKFLTLTNALSKRPVRTVSGWLCFNTSRIFRLFAPPGKIIAVTGGDHPVRVETINSIRPVIDTATHGDYVTVDFCPATVGDDDGTSPKAGNKNELSVPSSTKAVRVLIGYLVKYWFSYRLFIARSPSVIIFNRHPIEWNRDVLRSTPMLIRWLLYLLRQLAPKPHSTLLIDDLPAQGSGGQFNNEQQVADKITDSKDVDLPTLGNFYGHKLLRQFSIVLQRIQ